MLLGDDALRDGLIAEYRFAGDAADSSGQGHHGTVHGATLTADRFGNPAHAYHFDGVDDYIEVSPPPAFSSNALSVSVWARFEPRDFQGWTNCLVAQDDGNDADQSRRVFQLSTDHGHLVWHRMIGARDPMGRHRVRPGIWTHVVAVHDHGVNRLYVDGVLHDSEEHCLWTHPEQPLHIGRKGTPEPYFFFKGDLDDVRLWNRPLQEAEVRMLLGEGGWLPASPGLPVQGDPLTGRWGVFGVVYLDLFYDGDRGVTGQIMAGRPSNPAPIAEGSFDRATGRLRLRGAARHPETREPVSWSIEGMLDQGEICVLAVFNDYRGNHRLTRSGARPKLSRNSLRSHYEALAYRWRRRA